MYKRIIFDLDNTIIMWKKEYIIAVENTIKYFNLSISSHLIDKIIDSLEHKYNKISKEILLDEINKNCNLNLDLSFVNKLFEEQSLLFDIDEEVVNTLKYLSNKYELVILTNYFTEVQNNRLKNAKIDKYFKEIYGGDQVLVKPNSEGYKLACGDFEKSECLMVGDNYDIDILGALNFGISAVIIDDSNKILESDRYKIIKNFSELKNIL